MSVLLSLFETGLIFNFHLFFEILFGDLSFTLRLGGLFIERLMGFYPYCLGIHLIINFLVICGTYVKRLLLLQQNDSHSLINHVAIKKRNTSTVQVFVVRILVEIKHNLLEGYQIRGYQNSTLILAN